MSSLSLRPISMANVTERLVDLVRENPFLFDSNHQDHRDSYKRSSTWDSIAEAMEVPDMDGKQWREKWRNLRDVYIKRRKVMLKREVDSPKKSKWRFFDLLFFLEPYVAENEEETMHLSNFVLPVIDEIMEVNGLPTMCPPPPSSIKIKVKKTKRSIEENSINHEEASNFLFSASAPKKSREYSFMAEPDAISLLFESYAARMKNLTKETQSYVQLQLSQIFFNAENPNMQMPVICLPES